MKRFRPTPDGDITALINPGEAAVLRDLADQLRTLITQQPNSDPALLRLLPDAYPDDADASAEFRRYTHDTLTQRKVASANAVIHTLDTTTSDADADQGRWHELRLTRDEAFAWLTTLTDIRLTLAQRLGIVEDDQRSDDTVLQDLYDWLGFIQNAIVETLETQAQDA